MTSAQRSRLDDGAVSPPSVDLAALRRVTVVVVTHHSAHCVPALATHLAAFPHVVVVDNASDDKTPALVRKALPQAQVLKLKRNLGYGAANNRALDRVSTPYALLLNPDCVVDASAVSLLVATADACPTAAIVAPQLMDDRGRPQMNYGWPRWCWTSHGAGAQGLTGVGYACAAAWLLRVDAHHWRFDESFFLYYEDEDLCARVFKTGYQVLIQPEARAVHANRGSVKGRSVVGAEWRRGYHHSRSKIRFLARHVSRRTALGVRQRALWSGGVELLLRLLTVQPRLIARSAGRWLGMWHATP